jgi:hypothetical protein
MPYAINPDDYNVDFLKTDILGDITSIKFMEYLTDKNLQGIVPELVNSPAGNFTSKYGDKGLKKNIVYDSLKDPGSIDEWLAETGYLVNTFDISYQNKQQNVGTNQYGPATIEAYNEPSLIPEETGYLQYPTSVGGGVGDYFKDQLLNQQLNLGPGSAIDFESDLNDIAKERRKEEVLNRLKLNTENQTLGKLNLDPFGLLAGQDLFLRDYKITTNPTLAGKVFDNITDYVNLEIPTSPIPNGAFGKWGDDDGPQSYEDIMKSTASGTKGLIFSSIGRNKYGPILEEPKGRAANLFGSAQAPQPKKYTDNVDDVVNQQKEEEKGKKFVDKVKQSTGKVIDNIANSLGIGKEDDPTPSEFDNPSVTTDDITKNSEFGFDSLPSSKTDTWQDLGPSEFISDSSIGPDGPIGTKKPIDLQSTPSGGTKNNTISYDNSMYWGQNTNPFKRGILKYTQDLINNSKTNEQKGKARFIGVTNDDTNFERKTGRHKNYSMGNTVTSGEGGDTFYCRSWSVRNPYRNVRDLIRHGVNDGKNSLTRPDFNLSVLDTNGFVKVTPYITDESESGFNRESKILKLGNPEVQKYMLSIENLAWQNSEHILNLAPCEVGPNGGRIMWFPPYDISFSDNSSVNWDSTNFIGRGEPIYTYNNTERTGTLTFKIVVDHSMAMANIKKEFRGRGDIGDTALFQYFAGCKDPIEAALPMIPQNQIEEVKIQTTTKEEIFELNSPIDPLIKEIKFYFRNARNFEESREGTDLQKELDDGYLRGVIPTGKTDVNYTKLLSDTRNEQSILDAQELAKFLVTPEGKRYQIVIEGKTSEAGNVSKNQALSQKRAQTTEEYLYNLLLQNEPSDPVKAENLGSDKTFPTEKEWRGNIKRWLIKYSGEDGSTLSEDTQTGEVRRDDNTEYGDSEQLSEGAVNDRVTTIKLEPNVEIYEEFVKNLTPGEINSSTSNTSVSNNEIKEREQNNELLKKLTEISSKYMAQEKLKYFHPAFHSMTPEGFNSRLTFLKQCTRQGPSIDGKGPSNLVFGKPPICVLRVGDFYHTKIVIDSVNLTFDPLLWDLNPEGIGVQPMLCNVDLNFKFIGGSSLGGPISELQNAVGFNFFANTGLYNPRTIFSSVNSYKINRPDSASGLITEINDEVSTPTEKDSKYGFGAYIVPGQAIGLDGKSVNESDVVTPPKDKSEEKVKQDQAKDGTQKKDTEMSPEEKKKVENTDTDTKKNESTEVIINKEQDYDRIDFDFLYNKMKINKRAKAFVYEGDDFITIDGVKVYRDDKLSSTRGNGKILCTGARAVYFYTSSVEGGFRYVEGFNKDEIVKTLKETFCKLEGDSYNGIKEGIIRKSKS